MTTVIECHEISKRFGKKVANNKISLSVEAGDIYGLVGRNGSGKTTLIKQFMGSLIPTSGWLKFFDSPKLNQGRKRIGFLSDLSYFAHLSGAENLEYFACLEGIKDKQQIVKLMEHWDLDPKDKKQYRQYSTGMKQKLALSAAMLGNPDVLVLDEPINGLDPVSINHFRETMLTLQKEQGTTIFVSSHILSELAMMCTRFGFLENGSLVEELTREELHNKVQSALKLKTTDPDKTRQFFLDQGVMPQIKEEDETFYLPLSLYDAGDLSYALAQEGIYIVELFPQEHTLEDYYIELIGAASEETQAQAEATENGVQNV